MSKHVNVAIESLPKGVSEVLLQIPKFPNSATSTIKNNHQIARAA